MEKKKKNWLIFNNIGKCISIVLYLQVPNLNSVMAKYQNQYDIVIMFVDCCLHRYNAHWSRVVDAAKRYTLAVLIIISSYRRLPIVSGLTVCVRAGYLSAHLCFGTRLSALLCYGYLS